MRVEVHFQPFRVSHNDIEMKCVIPPVQLCNNALRVNYYPFLQEAQFTAFYITTNTHTHTHIDRDPS